MRQFNTWNNVQVKNEDHENFGRAGKVADTNGYAENEVPVMLDATPETEDQPAQPEELLVFDASDLRAL
ncbi:hypothetical protein LJR129_002479 [Acidovorax sp. LjRoot129]|uniref:hypothetical protein n=1 Tax=Acidovorax sp. LjRoot129 TaxID=3342260 RepID=UPI003ECC2A85